MSQIAYHRRRLRRASSRTLNPLGERLDRWAGGIRFAKSGNRHARRRLLTDLAQRPQQRGSFRLREFVDQRLVHDPGVDDQGAVDERGA